MNLDRTLNTYQAYSLAKISALNKKLVSAQYAQCGQINKLEKSLSKELTAINAANKMILENQLKEFKRQEKIRYYRNLAHNVKECIDIIDEQKDLSFKCFLLEIFLNPLSFYLQDATSNLEEIGDKEFCSTWEKVLQNNINLVSAVKDQFKTSPFNNLLEYHEPYKKEMADIDELVLNKEIKKLQIKKPVLETAKSLNSYQSKGCLVSMWIIAILSCLFFIIGLIGGGVSDMAGLLVVILFMVGIPLSILICLIIKAHKKSKNYPTYLANIDKMNNDMLQNYNDSVKRVDLELQNLETKKRELNLEHPYSKAKADISDLIPEWEIVVEKISSKLPVDQRESEKTEYDSLLAKVAMFAVNCNTFGITLIQRKFGIGFNRANKIMKQLVYIGIVEQDNSSNSGKVKVDYQTLQLILTHHNIV